MKKPVKNIYEPQFELAVNGEQWKCVASFDYSGPSDEVYTLDRDAGKITFGDGQRGQRPPNGSRIHATYTYGEGSEGANEATISLTWTSSSFRKNEVIEVIIEPVVDGINYRTCRGARSPYKWNWIGILCRKYKRCR